MSTTLFDLTGRRALITGSSRGIGLTLARGLAAAGAEIVLNGRDTARLDAAVGSLADAGHTASAYPFDVTDADAVEAAVATIEAEQGPIDILVNNAGIQARAPLADMAPAQWNAVLETNTTAVFLVGQAVARRMIARRRGRIVNIASLMAQVARPTIGPYVAAKHAVVGLTRSMATEWTPHGLTVNAIGPGYFATEMNTALAEDAAFTAWLEARTPAGRWGRVEELQGACIFLASDAAGFVSGQVLYVDGGLLATI